MEYADTLIREAVRRQEGLPDDESAIQYWLTEERGELMLSVMNLIRDYMDKCPTGAIMTAEEDISLEAQIDENINDIDSVRFTRRDCEGDITTWQSRWTKRRKAEQHKQRIEAILMPVVAQQAFNSVFGRIPTNPATHETLGSAL